MSHPTHHLPCLFLLLLSLAPLTLSHTFNAHCRGNATYKLTFKNRLTHANFGDLPAFPLPGLVFSPWSVVSHSNRQSFLVVRGYASRGVQAIAETGDNTLFQNHANRLLRKRQGVKAVLAGAGPTLPGNFTIGRIGVDCQHSVVTALAMIAPSPDWIVQISNVNTYSGRKAKFRSIMKGVLIAYDAGTDSGRDFTPPGNASLDLPTKPRQNIAPLVEDDTDRLEGRVVGKWILKKL